MINIENNKELIEKIFNDKELNKIDPNFAIIPEDIKVDIFEKYLYPNRIVLDLLEELESHESKTLNIINLVPILRNVLNDSLAIKYLLNNYIYICPYNNYFKNYFKMLYEDIIINKKKCFILVQDPIEDFSLTWVHYMYK
jgi:hypothetical protein